MNLSETLEQTFQFYLSKIHTAIPAKIVTYDYKTKKASVKPMIKRVLKDDDGDINEVLSMPIITGVPVIFQATVNSSITIPINKDDPVLLIFCERNIDGYLSEGIESQPANNRKFDLTDAVCIPGLFSFKDTSQAENNTDLLIKHKGGKINIDASGTVTANDNFEVIV